MSVKFSTIIALGSVLISIIATILSWLANQKSNKTQSRLLKIEQSRADARRAKSQQATLRTELRKTDKNSWRMAIINEGQSEARNIVVFIDGIDSSEHEVMLQGENLPEVLGSGSEASCLLGINLGCNPPFQIQLKWDDDYAEKRCYRTTLTF
ncbi:MAG: hypothetical protein ACLFWL_17720 [Candidatus Brocadiia bacterium]